MESLIALFLQCISFTWLAFNAQQCANYLDYIVEREIRIDWFPIDSDANRVANYRYNNSSWNLDMIATFIAENGWFNKDLVSKTKDYWLCQLHYNKTNAVRIDDPQWNDIMFQAKVCLDKWNAVPNPSKVWYWWRAREKMKKRILSINE